MKLVSINTMESIAYAQKVAEVLTPNLVDRGYSSIDRVVDGVTVVKQRNRLAPRDLTSRGSDLDRGLRWDVKFDRMGLSPTIARYKRDGSPIDLVVGVHQEIDKDAIHVLFQFDLGTNYMGHYWGGIGSIMAPNDELMSVQFGSLLPEKITSDGTVNWDLGEYPQGVDYRFRTEGLSAEEMGRVLTKVIPYVGSVIEINVLMLREREKSLTEIAELQKETA